MSREPASAKTKKANGICQYLSRLGLFFVRIVHAKNKLERPRRKYFSTTTGRIQRLARYDSPAAKQNVEIANLCLIVVGSSYD